MADKKEIVSSSSHTSRTRLREEQTIEITRITSIFGGLSIDSSSPRRRSCCTYGSTKTSFKQQKFYRCYDCFTGDNLGVCEGCRDVCHSGHRVKYEGVMTAYCDCGLRLAESTALLVQNAPMTNLSTTSPEAIMSVGHAGEGNRALVCVIFVLMTVTLAIVSSITRSVKTKGSIVIAESISTSRQSALTPLLIENLSNNHSIVAILAYLILMEAVATSA